MLMTVHGMHREASIEINASPDAVYALVAALPRMGEWSPGNIGGEWQGGGSGQVGDRFLGHNRAGERTWSAPVMVTQAERGRCFAFVVSPDAGPYVRWTYRLEPSGVGTRVAEVWDVEQLPPPLQSWTPGTAGRADALYRSHAGDDPCCHQKNRGGLSGRGHAPRLSSGPTYAMPAGCGEERRALASPDPAIAPPAARAAMNH